MNSSTRIRFGALTAAAAIVAGGFLATAPAHAATGTLAISNVDFTEGAWDTGLDITGSGFTADSVVTISIFNGTGNPALETTTVNADPQGDFTEVWAPTVALPLPAAGDAITVSATSNQGDDSNAVTLNVTAANPGPGTPPVTPSLTPSATTITTDELTDKNVGIGFKAEGFTANESVDITVTLAGKNIPVIPSSRSADANGELELTLYLAAGTATAGDLVVTMKGAQSGVEVTTTVTVTGQDVVAGPGGSTEPEVATPTVETAGASSTRLPVVAG